MTDKKRLIKRKSEGFTLLELLVVIGIIGLLVGLLSVSYSAAQKRGRDSKRKTDMKSLQDTLEQYYSNTTGPSFVYPIVCSDAETYLKSSWPEDPVNDGVLVYTEFCDANSYYLCARLEIDGTGNSTSLPINSNGVGHAWGSGNYQCVSNLQ